MILTRTITGFWRFQHFIDTVRNYRKLQQQLTEQNDRCWLRS